MINIGDKVVCIKMPIQLISIDTKFNLLKLNKSYNVKNISPTHKFIELKEIPSIFYGIKYFIELSKLRKQKIQKLRNRLNKNND
jgi:hypothetical protein